MAHECQKDEGGVRPQVQWSQNRHNTTVWTDSKQGSRYQPHYCLCQRYTETDPTGTLSPNHSRLSGANKVDFFRVDSLTRHLMQFTLDLSVVAMNKMYLIELVRDMGPIWDLSYKNYHNRDLRPKLWNEIGEKINVSS